MRERKSYLTRLLRNVLVVFIFFFVTIGMDAQCDNLVPNPSFEERNGCASGVTISGNEVFDDVDDWYMATNGTSDAFSACGGDVPSFYFSNIFFNQNAFDDNGYAGIYTMESNPTGVTGIDYSEYIGVRLMQPLLAGVNYDVSFYVSQSESSNYASNIGMYFSNNAISEPNQDRMNLTPQISTSSPVIEYDGWALVSGTYTATGGEEYITIGMFSGNRNVQKVSDVRSTTDHAYYLIDQVSIVEANTPVVIAGLSGSICSSGGSFQLDASLSNGLSYSWTPTLGLSNPNIANPVASNPGIYTVTVDYGGSCQLDDTVTVNAVDCNDCDFNLQIEQTGAGTGFCDGTGTDGQLYFYADIPPFLLVDHEIRNDDTNTVVSNTMVATNLPEGNYTYTVTSSLDPSCSQSISINLVMPTNPFSVDTFQITQPTIADCPNPAGTLQLEISGGNPYILGGNPRYMYSLGGAQTNTNFIFPNTTNLLTPGDYTLTVSDKTGCKEHFAFTIIDPCNPSSCTQTVTASADVTINQGDTTMLSATPTGGTPTYTWTASPTDTSLAGQENDQNPSVSPTQTTTYTVTADFGGGCTDMDMVTVTVDAVSSCLGQNLIRNPSFEDQICDPSANNSNCVYTGQSSGSAISGARIAEHWEHYSWSPDYYDPSSPLWGDQIAFDGQSYVGLFGYNNATIREYLGTELISPLVVGEEYFVSLKISRSEYAAYTNAVSHMGARFYVNPQSQPNNTSFPVPNDAQIFETSIIDDTNNWVTISGTFIADQAYTHMLIGNFFDNTTISSLNNDQAYYFVDQVEVYNSSTAAIVNAGTDVTINQGDTTMLSATPTGGTPTYTWSASPTDSSLSGQENDQNPSVSPTATTTYTVTADFGGGCTDDDEVIITVNPAPVSCAGANLVPNGDFESFVNCPAAFSAVSTSGIEWFVPGQGTTDYFNACNTTSQLSVPINRFGSQPSQNGGNGYVGFYASRNADAYKEYIAVQLTETLVAGETYEVEFYISLSDNSNFAQSELGMAFSENMPDFQSGGSDSATNYGLFPDYETPIGQFFTDRNNWMYINFQYIANGDENFITIGNFSDDPSRALRIASDPLPDYENAYYYLDGVSITSTSNVLIDISTNADVTINQGDTTMLSATPTGGTPTYSWTASPTDTSLSGQENDQNPSVSPTVTTTYTVTADFGGGCTDTDTVTVTVDTAVSCTGPNLVPNPSFEDRICDPANSPPGTCTWAGGGSSTPPSGAMIAEHWLHYSWSPDYRTNLVPFSTNEQAPYDGEAYIGLYAGQTGNSNIREYLGAELATPLVIGNTYTVSYRVSLKEDSGYGVDKLGARFYTNPVSEFDNSSFPIPNNSEVFNTTPILDYDNWTLVTGTFTATTAHTHILIGNFFDNANTNVQQAGNASGYSFAYYFVDMIEVYDVTSSNTVSAGADVTIDTGDTTTLTATPTGGTPTYTWSASPTDISLAGQENDQNPSVSPTQTTTYTVTADFGSGCTDTDTVTVFVGACTLLLDDSGITYTDATCNQTDGGISGIVINGGSGSETYSWTDSNATEVGTMLSLLNVGLGSYTLTVTDGANCSVNGTYNVNESGPPDLEDDSVQLADADCGQANGSITGIVYIGDTNGAVFEWTDAGGMVVGNTVDLNNIGLGSYILNVTDAAGCGAVVGPYAIGELGAPIVDLGALSINDRNCETDDGSITGITILNPTGNETYRWADADNAMVGDSPDLRDVGAGIYSLMITENGCSALAGPFVINDSCNPVGDIRIANTMTPNGDGSNDMFMIEGLNNYPNNRLYIYNRWGNKLYETDNYDNSWNGTFDGKPLPVATYYYILELNDTDKNIMKGYIAILR